jgi:two-component system cell cycle sensor histidine kinase/response regulator CckA
MSASQPAQIATHRILVVDDDDAVRRFITAALKGAGYEVVSAADGPQALSAQEQRRFDLCLVDFRMPQMNGDEVSRLLRRADPDVKVLYFTGYSDQLFVSASTLSANEAFLEKPAGVKGLLEAVSLLLFGRIRT